MQTGEGIAKEKSVEAAKNGKLVISVRDVCNEKRVPIVTVTINGESKVTDEYGEVEFTNQPVGRANVKVYKHFKEADYVTFVVHTLVLSKQNVTQSWAAKSSATEVVTVKEVFATKDRIRLAVFSVVDPIVFHRRNIIWNAGEGEDKYGHWWTVVDKDTSFGWWPKYPIGSQENRFSSAPAAPAVPQANADWAAWVQYKFDQVIYQAKSAIYETKESAVGQTLGGVEGELNGTSFGGTRTRDAHHVGGDEGEQQYQPVINDCREFSQIKKAIMDFAYGYGAKYGSEWSWRFEAGNHCHTFQKRLMKDCRLEKVKVLR